MIEWYLYIAKCKDSSLYTGISSKPDERIKRHNKGNGAKWIANNGPAKIIYMEKYNTYLEAYRREKQIKKWSRIKKETLIKSKK